MHRRHCKIKLNNHIETLVFSLALNATENPGRKIHITIREEPFS